MTDAPERHSTLQKVFGLLCLTVMLAGIVFLLDQNRQPYHGATVQAEVDHIDGVEQPVSNGLVPARAAPAAPKKLAGILHTMYADPDIDLLGSLHSIIETYDGTLKSGILESYLVWSIRTGKSGAYIDSLLNSAATNGHFLIPDALLTVSGRLDTPSLLLSVLLAADQPEPAAMQENYRSQEHLLRLSDSLAGLSLAYYGDPLEVTRIAAANGTTAVLAQAHVGQVLEIPGF